MTAKKAIKNKILALAKEFNDDPLAQQVDKNDDAQRRGIIAVYNIKFIKWCKANKHLHPDPKSFVNLIRLCS